MREGENIYRKVPKFGALSMLSQNRLSQKPASSDKNL
jgi:hypothetical protein